MANQDPDRPTTPDSPSDPVDSAVTVDRPASTPAVQQDDTATLPPDVGHATATLPPNAAAPPRSALSRPAPAGYEILGELGRGGMGVVYEARQVGLNRPVALKMILSGEHAEPRELVRFLAEAEAIASVRHPHVVQVHEFGEHDGRPFMALELCPNGSLADTIKANGALPPMDAARVAEKLARGVQAAHDVAIVHRDLKPHNVLLDAAGEPKVTDFGLAKRGAAADLTRTGAVMGTPAYMAPEQAAGRTKFVGPAADVYALGVILFELLTGRVPFTAEDTLSLILMVVEQEPPSPRALVPAVPRDLEVICLKCLEKEPGRRYNTAGELADDLGRYLRGEPVEARAVSSAERAVKWVRRNPGLSAVGAVAVLALVLGTGISIWQAVVASGQAERAGIAERDAKEREAAAQLAREDADKQRADAQEQTKQAEAARRNAQRLTAGLALDRGLGLCESGDTDRGLLWLARALENVPAGSDELDRAVRLNLSAWGPAAPTLVYAADPPGVPWTRLQIYERGKAAGGGVGFSPDGSRAVLPAGADAFALWDAASGKVTGQPVKHRSRKDTPAPLFSPDGTRVVCLNGDTATLCDATTGKPIGRPMFTDVAPTNPRFSPDGKLLLLGDVGTNYQPADGWLFDTATAAPLGTLTGSPVPVSTARLFGLNNRYALTSFQNGRIAVRDTTTGEPLENDVTRRRLLVRASASLGDGGRLAVLNVEAPPGAEYTTSRVYLQVLDLIAGRAGKVLPCGMSPWEALTVTPLGQGRWVFARNQQGQFALWDADAETLLAEGSQADLVTTNPAELSADGKHLLVRGVESWRVWSVATGKPVGPAVKLPQTAVGYGARFVANGATVYVQHAGGKQELFDPATGKPREGSLPKWSGTTLGFASPLLPGVEDNRLRVYDLATGKAKGEPHTPGDGATITTAAVAGKFLQLNLSLDGKPAVQVYDPAAGKAVGPVVPTGASFNVLNSDGTRIVAGDSALVVWDATTGKPVGEPIASPLHAQPGWMVGGLSWFQTVTTAAGPVAHVLATATYPLGLLGATEVSVGHVVLFDPTAGRLIARLPHLPPRFTAKSLRGWWHAVSADGNRVLTQPSSGEVRVWQTATGQAVGPPMAHGTFVRRAVISKDGGRVATVGEDGFARLWDTASGKPLGQPIKVDPTAVVPVTFTQGGGLVVMQAGGARAVSAAGELLGDPMPIPLGSFLGTPSGDRHLLRLDANRTVVWDAATGKVVGEPAALFAPAEQAFFAAGGSVLWVRRGTSRWAVVDAATRQPAKLTADAAVNLLAVGPAQMVTPSPDGKWVAAVLNRGLSGKNGLLVLDAATGATRYPLVEFGSGGALWVHFAGGGVIAAGDTAGTLHTFDAATGKAFGPAILQAANGSGDSLPVLSPDGKRAVVRVPNPNRGQFDPLRGMRLVDLKSGQQVGGPLEVRGSGTGGSPAGVAEAGFSPTGQLAWARAGDAIVVARADTGERLGEPVRANNGEPVASANGRVLAVGGRDGQVRLFDATAGQPIGTVRQPGFVDSVGLSPDGRSLVVVTSEAAGSGGVKVKGGANESLRYQLRVWQLPAAGGAAPAVLPEALARYAAFSPDGRHVHLLFDGGRKVVSHVWDTAERRAAHWMTHTNGAGAVAVTADGKLMAVGGTATADQWTGRERKVIHLFDPATGRQLRTLTARGEVLALAFTPDGKGLLVGGGGGAEYVRVEDGVSVGDRVSHVGTVLAVAVSADGKRLCTGSDDGTARVWDAVTAKQLTEGKVEGMVLAVAFTPDGKRVVTAAGDPEHPKRGNQGEARIWDAATGEPVGDPLTHAGAVSAVAVSPNGKLILTGSEDGTARVWDADTGKPVGEPLKHGKPLQSVAFHPTGESFLTAGEDGTARLWKTADRTPLCEPLKHAKGVTVAAYSPDGRYVLTGTDGNEARVWDAATGQPVGDPLPHTAAVFRLAAPADGRFLATASADGAVRVWAVPPTGSGPVNAANAQPIQDQPLRDASAVLEKAPAADQNEGGTRVRLIDLGTGKAVGVAFDPLALPGLKEAAGQVMGRPQQDWSRAAGRLALSLGDQLWLIDLTTGKAAHGPLKHPDGLVRLVALSADGSRAVTASAQQVRVWDAASGRAVSTFAPGSAPESAVLSGDGKLVAVVSAAGGGTVRVYHADSGLLAVEPLDHSAPLSAVEFAPVGGVLATGTADGTVRFWDAAAGKPLGAGLRHPGGVIKVAFSPDGKSLLTLCVPTSEREGNARLWAVPTPLSGTPADIARGLRDRTGKELEPSGAVLLLPAPEGKP
jgi:WD40 repeat protein